MEAPLEQSHARMEFNSLLYREARAIWGGGSLTFFNQAVTTPGSRGGTQNCLEVSHFGLQHREGFRASFLSRATLKPGTEVFLEWRHFSGL